MTTHKETCEWCGMDLEACWNRRNGTICPEYTEPACAPAPKTQHSVYSPFLVDLLAALNITAKVGFHPDCGVQITLESADDTERLVNALQVAVLNSNPKAF